MADYIPALLAKQDRTRRPSAKGDNKCTSKMSAAKDRRRFDARMSLQSIRSIVAQHAHHDESELISSVKFTGCESQLYCR